MSCFREIADLLSENKIWAAIEVVKERMFHYKELEEIWKIVTSRSALFMRAEQEYRKEKLSWEKYNVANSQVIDTLMDVAKEICDYIELRHKTNFPDDLLKLKWKGLQGFSDHLSGYVKEVKSPLSWVKGEIEMINNFIPDLYSYKIGEEKGIFSYELFYSNREERWQTWSSTNILKWEEESRRMLEQLVTLRNEYYELNFFYNQSPEYEKSIKKLSHVLKQIEEYEQQFGKWTGRKEWLYHIKKSFEVIEEQLLKGIDETNFIYSKFLEDRIHYSEKLLEIEHRLANFVKTFHLWIMTEPW